MCGQACPSNLCVFFSCFCLVFLFVSFRKCTPESGTRGLETLCQCFLEASEVVKAWMVDVFLRVMRVRSDKLVLKVVKA